MTTTQAGIVSLAPIGRETRERLIRALRWAHDTMPIARVDEAIDSHLVMVHGVLGAETRRDNRKQPIATAHEMLTFDGRLDNREELRRQLHTETDASASDASLTAAFLSQRGDDGLIDLLGDWSLVQWTPRSRRLMLARDFAGNRPLYYRATPDYIAWSTHLDVLSMFPDGCAGSELYLCRTLCLQPVAPLTAYEGVFSVPPGSGVIWTPGREPVVTRYWRYRPSLVRHRTYADYTAHFRSLMEDAIRVRLRGCDDVWSELSGGLDSSAIVCVAAEMQRRDRLAFRLRTASQIFVKSPESDESVYARMVVDRTGCEAHWLKDPQPDGERSDEHARRPLGRSWLAGDIGKLMKAHGGGPVVFSGELGDLVMGKKGPAAIGLLDKLHDEGAGAFVRSAYHYAFSTREPIWNVMARFARLELLPWTPQTLSDLGVPPGGARPAEDIATRAKKLGLTPSVVERAGTPRHTLPEWKAFRPAKRYLVDRLNHLLQEGLTQSPDDIPEIWRTYPYAHRPLVEFSLGVPESLMWEPGNNRALMRRSLEGILPEAIRRRTDKGYASPAILRAARGRLMEERDHIADFVLTERGYVDVPACTTLLDRALSGDGAALSPARLLVSIEAWARRAWRPDAANMPASA